MCIVTLVPFIRTAGEVKTKPTQHSVKELTGLGIQPDILLCRCDRPLDKKVKAKIAHFLQRRGKLRRRRARRRNVSTRFRCSFTRKGSTSGWSRSSTSGPAQPNLGKWRRIVKTAQNPKVAVNVAVVGKYVEPWSIRTRACTRRSRTAPSRTTPRSRSTTSMPRNSRREMSAERLANAHAIIMPGGFGERGIEGKISAVSYARENGVPILGICLGLHMMVIEFARNVLGLEACQLDRDRRRRHPIR